MAFSRDLPCDICGKYAGYVDVEASGRYFPGHGCDLYGGNNYSEEAVSKVKGKVKVLRLNFTHRSWKERVNNNRAADILLYNHKYGVDHLANEVFDTAEELLSLIGLVLVCHFCYSKGAEFIQRALKKPRLALILMNLKKIKREKEREQKRKKLERALDALD